MLLIEQVRAIVVRHVLSSDTVSEQWRKRRRWIRETFSNPDRPTPQELILLGEHLSTVFRLVGRGKRTNKDVSGGGSVWSGLVTWYLNLCYAGTHAVAFPAGKYAPDAAKDALAITYQNTSLRADTDVLVLALPLLSEEPSQPSAAAAFRRLEEIVSGRFRECGVINVQCKTTWNENAQVPMLWNMVYQLAREGKNPPNGFLVGRRQFDVSNLAHFAYSFVTVPTVTGGGEDMESHLMPVRRVSALSGGAFWGYPTKQDVCRSLGEFFGHQFSAKRTVMPNVSALGHGYVQSLASRAPLCDTAAFKIR